MFATVLRTDARQIAEHGQVFLNRGNYGRMTEEATRAAVRDWALSEGVIEPQVIVQADYDAAVYLGPVDASDPDTLHSFSLAFEL